jgi:hypothetical protein
MNINKAVELVEERLRSHRRDCEECQEFGPCVFARNLQGKVDIVIASAKIIEELSSGQYS